jgi:signal peptidase I
MTTERRNPWYGRWYVALGLLGVAIALYASFRVFVFDWYRTPSAAMAPTLRVDDIFFVSKLAKSEVHLRRGDIIVYRARGGVDYVKRLIGLPGDTVAYDGADKRLTVNGTAAKLDLLGDYEPDPANRLARETFGEREHFVLVRRGFQTPGGTYEVPAGHYFVLGDNRDNSLDSRFRDHGFVPREAIVGKVGLIWHLTDDPLPAGAAAN